MEFTNIGKSSRKDSRAAPSLFLKCHENEKNLGQTTKIIEM